MSQMRHTRVSRTAPQVAIISPMALPLVVAVARGVSDFGRRHGGWRVEVVPRPLGPSLLQYLGDRGINGLVVVPRTKKQARIARTLTLPTVGVLYHMSIKAIGRESDDLDPTKVRAVIPTVVPDEQAVGRSAARHLLERGHTRFVCLSARWRVGRLRQVGFVNEVERAGGTCLTLGDAAISTHASPLPPDVGRQEALPLLNHVEPPAGVFVYGDRSGIEVTEAAASVGLRVPEDLAVVGVNNDELLVEFARTPLSSVDLDVEQIGRVAAGILDRLLRGQPAETTPGGLNGVWTVPPRGVIARQSTRMQAFFDEQVREAAAFMGRHACRGLTVDEVCRSLAISRRSLERKMLAAIGRTPAQEIRRLRIDKARELIRRSDLTLAEIAGAVGFANQSSFSTAFRLVCGATPGRWRRERLGRGPSEE
jgi:LacI family transcriptional regulator